MRLIDADVLIETFRKEMKEGRPTVNPRWMPVFMAMCDDACGIIYKQEIVDPVKHGHWIPKHRFDDDEYDEDEYDSFECSDCGYEVDFEEVWNFEDFKQIYKANYCNCCGAKMGEDVSE